MAKLWELGILDNTLFSFYENASMRNSIYFGNIHTMPSDYGDLHISVEDKWRMTKFLTYNCPTTLDHPDGASATAGNYWVSVKEHYLDTYVSIVNETGVGATYTFVTEKTIRPIICRHPFIVWGNPFTLQYLRSLGFKTFGWLFDESYDEETNTNKRCEMIISEIDRVNKLPIEEIHKLYYDNMDVMNYNYEQLKTIHIPLSTQILKNIL